MYALAQQSNFCFEKMVYKLGIVISAIAVFSGTGMRLNATESVLGYYVQDKIMLKEQSIALFLLNEKWKKEIEEKYSQHKIREIADGITLKKISCPIGVIGVIFEARPDVISQISSLAIKSSNAVILKGGSEAENTNKIINPKIITAFFMFLFIFTSSFNPNRDLTLP